MLGHSNHATKCAANGKLPATRVVPRPDSRLPRFNHSPHSPSFVFIAPPLVLYSSFSTPAPCSLAPYETSPHTCLPGVTFASPSSSKVDKLKPRDLRRCPFFFSPFFLSRSAPRLLNLGDRSPILVDSFGGKIER